MITQNLANMANFTNLSLMDAFSLKMWGGATFDVSMRFLHECSWGNFKTLRGKVLDFPFQMLFAEIVNYVIGKVGIPPGVGTVQQHLKRKVQYLPPQCFEISPGTFMQGFARLQ